MNERKIVITHELYNYRCGLCWLRDKTATKQRNSAHSAALQCVCVACNLYKQNFVWFTNSNRQTKWHHHTAILTKRSWSIGGQQFTHSASKDLLCNMQRSYHCLFSIGLLPVETPHYHKLRERDRNFVLPRCQNNIYKTSFLNRRHEIRFVQYTLVFL